MTNNNMVGLWIVQAFWLAVQITTTIITSQGRQKCRSTGSLGRQFLCHRPSNLDFEHFPHVFCPSGHKSIAIWW